MNLLLILFLTLLNGVFAMSELAVVSSRKVRLESMGKKGDRKTAAALELLARPTRFLSTVQVGITSIGMLNGIVGEAAFSGDVTEILMHFSVDPAVASVLATALVIAAITFVTIIFGELVPKRIGQMYPETVARWVAIPMRWIAALAKPFVVLLALCTQGVLKLLHMGNTRTATVTQAEISASLAEGVGAGVIEEREHQMVRNVFSLDDRPLTSIMVPRGDIEWLSADQTVAEALATIASRGEQGAHSWYPVCRGNLDDVIGLIPVPKLLQLGSNCNDMLGTHVLRAEFIPETLSAMEMLEQWRTKPRRVLLVVDEYGVVQGLLTARDLLEAITGELKPDIPVNAWATPLPDGRWLFDGTIPVSELKVHLAIDALPLEDKGRYNTLAGLLMSIAGHVPLTGEKIQCDGWFFQIARVDGHQIERVLAYRAENRIQAHELLHRS